MKLWLAAAITIFASPCFAQQIAPSRVYGNNGGGNKTPLPELPGDQMKRGMLPPTELKPQFGFHPTPLIPAVIAPIPKKLATEADTTIAEPLTRSEPGRGRMTAMFDDPPNDLAMPGQKRDPIAKMR